MLGTVNRAGRVLDLFSGECPEWGATAVAQELDIAKSQAHELLLSLADIGLLQRAGSGRYRLGWRVAALHSLFLETSPLGRSVAPVLRTLGARYGETLRLAMWGPGTAICVAARAGSHADAVSPGRVGARLPGHCTSAGKVLLASRSQHDISLALDGDGLTPMTARTIVTRERLRDELEDVHRRGFAVEDQEHVAATCGVAAPIRDAGGEVIAALGMSVPARRWQRSRHEYTQALVAAAALASKPVRGHRPERQGRRVLSAVPVPAGADLGLRSA